MSSSATRKNKKKKKKVCVTVLVGDLCGMCDRGALLWGVCERWMCDKIWGSVTKYKMAGDKANRKPVKLGVCDVSWRGGKRRG